MTIKGSLQVKILNRGVFVENFQSVNGQKLTVLGGLNRENCESQSSDPLGNQTTPKHVIQCKKYGDIPKNVFSRARKAIKKKKKEPTFEHYISSIYRAVKCVTTVSSICIPAFSEATIPVCVPNSYNNETSILEPLSSFQFRLFATARSVSQCENNKTACTILNYNPQNLVLRKGVKVASIQSINSIVSFTPYVERNAEEEEELRISPVDVEDRQTRQELDAFFLAEYNFRINSQITNDEKYELLQLTALRQ